MKEELNLLLQEREEALELAKKFRQHSARLEQIAQSLETGSLEPRINATKESIALRSLFGEYNNLRAVAKSLLTRIIY